MFWETVHTQKIRIWILYGQLAFARASVVFESTDRYDGISDSLHFSKLC